MGVGLVFLGVDLADGVKDPCAIWGDNRSADALEFGEVVECDVALGLCRGERGNKSGQSNAKERKGK